MGGMLEFANAYADAKIEALKLREELQVAYNTIAEQNRRTENQYIKLSILKEMCNIYDDTIYFKDEYKKEILKRLGDDTAR